MIEPKLRSMVKEYFRGVDDEDLPALLGTLSEDCAFSIETHEVKLIGHDAISGMFHRLWFQFAHSNLQKEKSFFVESHATQI